MCAMHRSGPMCTPWAATLNGSNEDLPARGLAGSRHAYGVPATRRRRVTNATCAGVARPCWLTTSMVARSPRTSVAVGVQRSKWKIQHLICQFMVLATFDHNV